MFYSLISGKDESTCTCTCQYMLNVVPHIFSSLHFCTRMLCSESRRARVRPMDGTLLCHVSLLPRQPILEVRKLEFGTALARCCAENKCWRPGFGRELAVKCIPELSFQQRHDIGIRSLENFWRCWAILGRI